MITMKFRILLPHPITGDQQQGSACVNSPHCHFRPMYVLTNDLPEVVVRRVVSVCPDSRGWNWLGPFSACREASCDLMNYSYYIINARLYFFDCSLKYKSANTLRWIVNLYKCICLGGRICIAMLRQQYVERCEFYNKKRKDHTAVLFTMIFKKEQSESANPVEITFSCTFETKTVNRPVFHEITQIDEAWALLHAVLQCESIEQCLLRRLRWKQTASNLS